MKNPLCLPPAFRSPALWAAALALFGSSAAHADYPALIKSSNPVAYYRLEEATGASVATDATANLLDADINYHMDEASNPDYPQLGLPGIDVNSYAFQKASPSFVNIPYNALLNPTLPDGTHGAAFSAECWVRPTTQPSDYSVPLSMFGKYGTGIYGNASGWNFYQTGGPNSSWNFNMKNGAFLTSGVTIQLLS